MAQNSVSRRRFLKNSATAAVATVAPAIRPSRARAGPKTLKILQWKHFVPGHDPWFDEYVKGWGKENDTRVVVDHAAIADIDKLAKAEVEAKRGHDLVLFITPPAQYEDFAIDHYEVYEECERKYKNPLDFSLKSTYNPKTNKYFGFCGAFFPAVISYRKDLWDAVAAVPESWDNVLEAGRRIRLLHDKPVGFSLAADQNSGQTMRAIMYSFGSSEQDASGNPALKSRETLEVIKYVKALYEQAMTDEMLTWDNASNNRFILSGEGCLTLDTMSIARASENMKLPILNELRLAKAPVGPSARLAPSFGFLTYVVWNFAQNIEGAKRFLVDYVASSRQAFLASGFQNMSTFPVAVPDLAALVANDPAASPPDKYSVVVDAPSWTTNIGHPGYTSPAISEIYNKGIISTMCARVATGQLTPEEALDQADREVRAIFQNWKERGKV